MAWLPRRSGRNVRGAFTLIELLVVIAIIAVLIGILPFIEGGNLAVKFDLNQRPYLSERSDVWFNNFGPEPTAGPQNVAPCQQMPKIFSCPTTPPSKNGGPGEYKDYALNAGGGVNISSCCPERALTSDGIGHKNSKVRLADI